jgi:hypothetical protein
VQVSEPALLRSIRLLRVFRLIKLLRSTVVALELTLPA